MKPVLTATVLLSMCVPPIASAQNSGGADGFFGRMGSLVDDVFDSDDQPASQGARARRAAPPAPAASSWTVVTVHGSTVAADSHGLSVTYDPKGNLLVSLVQQGIVPQNSGPFNTQLVVNGARVGEFPSRIQGTAVIVDDARAVSTILSAFKGGRKYEVTTPFFKFSGSLAGSSKALDQVEQGARFAQIAQQTIQSANAAPSDASIAQNESGTSSAAALSEEDSAALNKVADDVANLTAQISVLERMLANQKQLEEKAPQEEKVTISATIQIINSNINDRKKNLKSEDQKLHGYLTSVTPNNRNQYLTARRASEIYPRVPYYIPGTEEIGEFWVEPFVTDKGEQRFKFHFMDPKSPNDNKRETIEMSRDELSQVQQGLFKLYEWSNKAQEQKIRKIYSKRAICFPERECPADGEKGEMGRSSTEVRFQIYEDGATAGRIQRNKGKFEEGYNVSIDSALLLQAYSTFVLTESDFDYKQGTQSVKDLDAMFQ